MPSSQNVLGRLLSRSQIRMRILLMPKWAKIYYWAPLRLLPNKSWVLTESWAISWFWALQKAGSGLAAAFVKTTTAVSTLTHSSIVLLSSQLFGPGENQPRCSMQLSKRYYITWPGETSSGKSVIYRWSSELSKPRGEAFINFPSPEVFRCPVQKHGWEL